MSKDVIDHRVKRKRLRLIHQGVYAAGHVALRREAWWLAAVLACGEGAVLSHRNAAALWGIRPRNASRVDVTARRSLDGRPGIAVHRPRTLLPGEITVRAGIPVTTVARTLVDLASIVPRAHVARALHEAEVLRVLDVATLRDAIGRHRRRRGLPDLRALLDDHTLIAPSAEAIVAHLIDIIDGRGLERPVLNPIIEGYEVDAAWPRQRLIVELDGAAVHHTRRAFERDRVRDAILQLAGWRVIRLTWRRLTQQPNEVAATLLRALTV